VEAARACGLSRRPCHLLHDFRGWHRTGIRGIMVDRYPGRATHPERSPRDPPWRSALSQSQRYYLTIPNLGKARGPDPELSFQGASPQSFAEALQEALRQPVLFQRWKARQPDPDEVDQSLAPVDPDATVTAEMHDLHTTVQVVTNLTHFILRHRLFILIGPNWQLRDVAAA
jgi:hypothetical protein